MQPFTLRLDLIVVQVLLLARARVLEPDLDDSLAQPRDLRDALQVLAVRVRVQHEVGLQHLKLLLGEGGPHTLCLVLVVALRVAALCNTNSETISVAARYGYGCYGRPGPNRPVGSDWLSPGSAPVGGAWGACVPAARRSTPRQCRRAVASPRPRRMANGGEGPGAAWGQDGPRWRQGRAAQRRVGRFSAGLG